MNLGIPERILHIPAGLVNLVARAVEQPVALHVAHLGRPPVAPARRGAHDDRGIPLRTRRNALDGILLEDLHVEELLRRTVELVSLRKSNDILINGDCKLLDLTDSDIITFTRNNNGEKILVICSFSDKRIKFDIPKEYKATKLLISNYDSADFEGDVTTYLEPYEGRAYIIG